MIRAAALTLTSALVAVALAACGAAGSGSGDADPASLAPADVPVYLQATVQPQGEQRDAALAAAGKILGTGDPAGKLRGLIDNALAEDGSGLTWEKDFAPWLGEEAGLWVSNLSGDEPTVAAIVATTDTDAAKATLAKLEQSDKEHTYTKRSYKGIDYAVDDDGTADGVIGDFVVLGTEDGFKRTADTQDGDDLAGSDRYRQATEDLAGDSLGHYYVDIAPVLDAAAKADPSTAGQLQQFQSIFGLGKLGPITGSFQANGDRLAIDTRVTGLGDGPYRKLLEGISGASDLLDGLPGQAWGAYAVPKLGESLQSTFTAVAGALGGAALTGQFKQATGLDLQQDVLSWVGDTGVFAAGTDASTLGGAVVISVTDQDKATAAFSRIVGAIGRDAGVRPVPAKVDGADAAFSFDAPGAPHPVVLARGNGRVVAAFGEDAAAEAIDPSSELGDSATLKSAKAALGDDLSPLFVLSLPDVVKLVDSMGGADADFEQARPYLDAFGVLTAGGAVDGDTATSRLAATLK